MYKYEDFREEIVSGKHKVTLLTIKHGVKRMLKSSGAFVAQKVMTGDPWVCLACLDYMVELGDIKEVEQKGEVFGQERIFIEC